jgi:hypothetical protein
METYIYYLVLRSCIAQETDSKVLNKQNKEKFSSVFVHNGSIGISFFFYVTHTYEINFT